MTPLLFNVMMLAVVALKVLAALLLVNVPPHSMGRLLRSLPRWPRPDQKVFSSQV